MPTLPVRFPIKAKPAVGKFLVDMRLTSERAFRRWNKALSEAIAECPLSPREQAALLQSHPLDDYFFAGLVALHANAIRVTFSSDVAESLMRELAVQVDAAVGRTDSTVSHLVFVALTRIRKGRLEGNEIAHDYVIETLLERVGVDKRKATQHLMTQLLLRQTLCEPLALAAPNWWSAFAELYDVVRPPRVEAPVRFVTVIDPASTVAKPRRTNAPPRPAIPQPADGLPAQIISWITQKPRTHHIGH